MMKKRLELLYELLPQDGVGIIDVGTDHGMIPIRLAKDGYGGNIIASDLHADPLKKAKQAAEEAGVYDCIRFQCCDGLALCKPDDIDCILIAGMGGDTVCRILDEAEWLFDRSYRLVLQPMTHPEVVRYWLIHNEYRIAEEGISCENNNIYQAFAAIPGHQASCRDAEYLIGRRKAQGTGSDAYSALAGQELQKLDKKLRAMEESDHVDQSSYLFFRSLADELRNID